MDIDAWLNSGMPDNLDNVRANHFVSSSDTGGLLFQICYSDIAGINEVLARGNYWADYPDISSGNGYSLTLESSGCGGPNDVGLNVDFEIENPPEACPALPPGGPLSGLSHSPDKGHLFRGL